MSSSPSQSSMQQQPEVTIRPLREEDLPVADRIMRLAFGTFLGLPDPLKFMGDADYVRTRWRADPSRCVWRGNGRENWSAQTSPRDGEVSDFSVRLTIRPDLWDRGIAQQLLRPTMDLIRAMGDSPRGPVYVRVQHEARELSIKNSDFGRAFLRALMELPITAEPVSVSTRWARFSELSVGEKQLCLEACRELTNSIYEGLDRGTGDSRGGPPKFGRYSADLGRRRA